MAFHSPLFYPRERTTGMVKLQLNIWDGGNLHQIFVNWDGVIHSATGENALSAITICK